MNQKQFIEIAKTKVDDDQVSSFVYGADWMQDYIIQKAREWFKNNWRNYVDQDRDGMIRLSGWSNDFIAAMYEDKTINSKKSDYYPLLSQMESKNNPLENQT